jgi:LTXXQ motif family protein
MRLNTTSRITAACLAMALALPVAAWAQTAAPPAPGSQRENVEQRIADMHATLHITQAQEAQFNQFGQIMLDNAQAMEALMGKNAAAVPTQNAIAIMDGYSAVAQQHARDVQMLSAAFGKLYASLTPVQQKAADEMFRATTMQHMPMQHEPKPGG